MEDGMEIVRLRVNARVPYGPHVVVEVTSCDRILLWSGGKLWSNARSAWPGVLWMERGLHVVVEARRVSVWRAEEGPCL